ncbi:MAG: prepilin-type N-terminal cleavage/methylation domain-containing protein [Myxococcales bacterium]|nr:prepilin-type N-terminal cleavage/methylation domain-containing protein [Deltaproteobacteria bacterium]NND27945.1 prepilin-type N-terminal cleavage/methylation domain-containing protein [Myxococcales bacterium]MBT8482844.1 prepilin-type N-terminal cleavage/methylation domain-containing protein [Deltaproteobacteria bacterium]NNK08065.1 prepilin-type N-terminal cleavage/methylation domain-containing protein [Myxococcales bacterium]NNK42623.1 prepilin-type N-terminal cleavage/methylation domain
MTRDGFTLLEVMIAVAILGLSLTAIFSSEVGAANIAARARRQNVAVTLARCKMGEIEEVIGIEGLPALEKKDTDSCCEHAPVEGYECEWIVERIILPEFGAGDDESEEDEGGDETTPKEIVNAAVDEVTESGGPTEQVIAGGAGNLAMLALQIGFPILKPFLEEQVRRATVTVRWTEGSKQRGFDVTQYLVSAQPARTDDQLEEEE